MTRRMKDPGPGDKVWLYLEWMPDGAFRPVAASLACKERVALSDMAALAVGAENRLFAVRADARVLVDACGEIPVYVGSEERHGRA
jgi:hypothetical protein